MSSLQWGSCLVFLERGEARAEFKVSIAESEFLLDLPDQVCPQMGHHQRYPLKPYFLC